MILFWGLFAIIVSAWIFSWGANTCSNYLSENFDSTLIKENFLPQDLSEHIGTTNYYLERAKDFQKRNPNDPIPYYLEYGEKYQNRFLSVRPNLDSFTQRWVTVTHSGLQAEIENLRATNPIEFAMLEKNFTCFRNFCFQTHAKVYVESGFCDLPVSSTFNVILIPDIFDLLSFSGIIQGLEVISLCSSNWRKRAILQLSTYLAL